MGGRKIKITEENEAVFKIYINTLKIDGIVSSLR